MGVHGLMSYMSENSSLYLKPHELSDCPIIIDGNNIAHSLGWHMKSDSVFGGDYDEYFTVVKDFMLALKKCNVSPILLFDGGCKKSKLKTKLGRRQSSIFKLECYCQGFSSERFFPLFLLDVFKDVVMELGFTCIQCDFEADGEIAAVARALNCPVLGYDSDYFIYDVLYIPFNTISGSPVKRQTSDKYYLKCSVYNVNDFLKTVGLEKPLLPILACLLGNDHVENNIFLNFFNHINIPKVKHKSHNQRKIRALMQWMKNENFDSAVKGIISHLKKKYTNKVTNIFDTIVNDYSSTVVSESVLNELTSKFGDLKLLKSDFNIDWPLEITKLFRQTLLPGYLVNVIEHQFYLTPVQIENLYEESCQVRCMKLIKAIFMMMFPYLKKKEQLQIYLIIKKRYARIKMDADPSESISLDEALKKPLETRLKLLCDLVGVSQDEIDIVPYHPWAIFIMSFLYWVKEFKNSISLSHVHAFIIMVIANQVVQTRVGYYRNSPNFTKRYGGKLAKLEDTELSLSKSNDFKEMLENVSFYECLLVQKDLIPLRRTTHAGARSEYCLSTIHLFNCFQACLDHITTINALLNFPLPCVKISDFYSGTLLFNLYVYIKSECSVDKFGSILFAKTPNLNQIYTHLCENLAKVLGKTEVQVRAPRRRRTKRNRSSRVKVVEIVTHDDDDDDDDDGEYKDENNVYCYLR